MITKLITLTTKTQRQFQCERKQNKELLFNFEPGIQSGMGPELLPLVHIADFWSLEGNQADVRNLFHKPYNTLYQPTNSYKKAVFETHTKLYRRLTFK